MYAEVVVPFVVAVVLMWLSPGPAMTVLLRTAAMHGFTRATATILGLELGLYFWALAAGAGAAALVATSHLAFVVLRVSGAVVLLFLGVRAWRAAWQRPLPEVSSPRPVGRFRSFANGLVVQLANPKTATLLIAFYPQFVPRGRPMFATTAVLAFIQVMTELVLYLTVAFFTSRAGDWFRRPAVRRRLEAVSGTVLVGLGVRVAALHQ